MIIFAGPSIDQSKIRSVLPEADIRPPARKGDILQASQERPQALGLIDGFFEGVPAVWHKEILWAMKQGIAVYGASSMGALRAAELHAFGMIGVGWIFEAFRNGNLEDDDEVALRHGPSEMNYVALSEPMVNIRVSLERAVKEGVLDQNEASSLTSLAKKMYFPERSWESLLAQASEAEFANDALDKLRKWLPQGRVDQKRRDAMALLAAMGSRKATSIPSFEFQHTVMWENLKRERDQVGPTVLVSLIFDLLRHDPNRYRGFRKRALKHMSPEMDEDVPRDALNGAMTQFRKENRLYTGAALNAWLADKGLDLVQLQDDLRQDILHKFIITENPMAFRDALLQLLKDEGYYDRVMEKAKTQAEIIHNAGFDEPTPAAIGVSHIALLLWYFETFRGEAIPQDMDQFLYAYDYANREEFEQMMARQYVLWQDQV